MPGNENGYISVVRPALIEPLIDLIEKLERRPAVRPNEVQIGQRENGYSCAIIVLSVILFESALNRTAYVRGERGNGPDYFMEISPDKNISAKIEEIFALRKRHCP